LIYQYSTSKLNDSNCKGFFKLAGKGNLTALNKGSIKRRRLLDNAIHCLGLNGKGVNKEDLDILNNLACDLNGTIIEKSDSYIVELLKNCELTSDQAASINKILKSGNTTYGAPSTWNIVTLKALGNLSLYLETAIWSSINKVGYHISFFLDILSTYRIANLIVQDSDPMSRAPQFLFSFIISEKQHMRFKGKTGSSCTVGNITRKIILENTFPVKYNADQFDKCLDNDVVIANLGDLAQKALSDNYLQIIKDKLDQIYPGGVLEDQLKLLKSIARKYNVTEISKWNITAVETIASLMDPKDSTWEDIKASAIITRYLQLGGKLDAVALKAIGGQYLCTLNDSQINNITSSSLMNTNTLNVSNCSQSKKDILYNKSKEAFANKRNDTIAYYNLIKGYLGGALAADLKTLSKNNISMDIDTFTKLNPTEILKLSVEDIKGILGTNLPDLKERENDPAVRAWINSQQQSALDTLGIGLTG
uniref:Mesothelin n=1 Tax=Latimeria chalumnae TaxID=7897 RepID=H3AER6_LATCH